MTPQKLKQNDSEQYFLLSNVKKELLVRIQQTSNHNNTFDISAVVNSDEADGPDALRVLEVIIVICVLLLWCGSIYIFIRHSEILRIRHRDLPFRSAVKTPLNLNNIIIVNRTSDSVIHSKSQVSSVGGVTPPIYDYSMNEYKHAEASETISSTIPLVTEKGQLTYSFDLDTSPSTKYSSDKYNDKEQLLHPNRISSEIRESLLALHRKSMENLSTVNYSTSHSTNDMLRRKHSDGYHLIVKRRCVQESPV